MRFFFCKTRLVVHLLRGIWLIGVHFPRASQEQRRALIRAWSLKMMRLCGLSLVVHHDDARLDAGVMVVSNHVSWMDIFVINAWCPTPFVSKAEVRRWPLVGWFARQLDTIFLQREKRSDAKRIMHELAGRLERDKRLCVFPEGTTSGGHVLQPFHTNLFQAPVTAGRPVQPVCLMYEDAHGNQTLAPAYVDDVSLMQSLDAMLRAKPLTAHVYVGDALPSGDDRRILAKQAEHAVREALQGMQGREIQYVDTPQSGLYNV